MYAVVVRVSIKPDRAAEAAEQLKSEVIPRMQTLPGVVAGYWTRAADQRSGLALVVFNDEESAKAAAANLPAPAEGVTVADIEIREVVAQI